MKDAQNQAVTRTRKLFEDFGVKDQGAFADGFGFLAPRRSCF